ncbi:MAG: hypothetical protein EOP56_03280 [Sphingobacteriales bacterium]|nr:MAG: hypothetical protein EOP56_03280 [Sphingobacteriales bacterium]
MSDVPASAMNQTKIVTSFQALVSTPFEGAINAIGWTRSLDGDYAEIVAKLKAHDNIMLVEEPDLLQLELSDAGHLARQTILSDLHLLKAHGAAPSLNLIKQYEADDSFPFFPTDVYSFHVDRAPIPTDTILCTYYGATSEILPKAQAEQKILVPEIRAELKKLYDGPEDGFDAFLSEHFFDLHYRPKPGAEPIRLEAGHMWRLAVDHPESKVIPCVHRAPKEKPGEYRLLMIC